MIYDVRSSAGRVHTVMRRLLRLNLTWEKCKPLTYDENFKTQKMRLPGVEPGSIAWKAIILTVGLQTPLWLLHNVQVNINKYLVITSNLSLQMIADLSSKRINADGHDLLNCNHID